MHAFTADVMQELLDELIHPEGPDATTIRTTAKGASQVALERLYASNQLLPALREDFTKNFEHALQVAEIPVDFGVELMVQIYLHRKAPIETMVGILRGFFTSEESPTQACADAILEACEKDVCDVRLIQKRNSFGEIYPSAEIYALYSCTPETARRVEQYQYPLPMIDSPRHVENNRQTGYQTIKGSIILKNNHHEDDVCLDHINRMNQQPLRVNQEIVTFLQNSWKNLDKRQPDEEYDEFRKRKKAFQKYDRISRDVIEAMISQGNRFWLTHRYDKRGRVYAQGYHVNYQGNAWNKAIVEFADAEPLNKE